LILANYIVEKLKYDFVQNEIKKKLIIICFVFIVTASHYFNTP